MTSFLGSWKSDRFTYAFESKRINGCLLGKSVQGINSRPKIVNVTCNFFLKIDRKGYSKKMYDHVCRWYILETNVLDEDFRHCA